ncbi:hypothetical protein H4582DRAFT_592461 [Lactarius indigo]|nr:hypothetical protein H4582DRAFT_592461 [Lactarius indigo]
MKRSRLGHSSPSHLREATRESAPRLVRRKGARTKGVPPLLYRRSSRSPGKDVVASLARGKELPDNSIWARCVYGEWGGVSVTEDEHCTTIHGTEFRPTSRSPEMPHGVVHSETDRRGDLDVLVREKLYVRISHLLRPTPVSSQTTRPFHMDLGTDCASRPSDLVLVDGGGCLYWYTNVSRVRPTSFYPFLSGPPPEPFVLIGPRSITRRSPYHTLASITWSWELRCTRRSRSRFLNAIRRGPGFRPLSWSAVCSSLDLLQSCDLQTNVSKSTSLCAATPMTSYKFINEPDIDIGGRGSLSRRRRKNAVNLTGGVEEPPTKP